MANGMGLPDRIRASIQEQEQELLQAGRRVNFRRIRQRRLYSRHLFAPGKGGTIPAGVYPIFTTIEGGTGQGYRAPLTTRETNWLSNARLTSQQNLVVRGVGVRIYQGPTDPTVYPPQVEVDPFVPLHPQDVGALASGIVLAIKYITEVVPIGLLRDFPAAGGMYGYNQNSRQAPGSTFGVAAAGVSGTPDTSGGPAPQVVQAYGHNAVAALQAIPCWERRFRVPLLIANNEQFSAELQIPEDITLLGAMPAEQTSEIFRATTGCAEIEVNLWCTESFDEQS